MCWRIFRGAVDFVEMRVWRVDDAVVTAVMVAWFSYLIRMLVGDGIRWS